MSASTLVPYPNSSVDQLAVRSISAGVAERWGTVTSTGRALRASTVMLVFLSMISSGWTSMVESYSSSARSRKIMVLRP